MSFHPISNSQFPPFTTFVPRCASADKELPVTGGDASPEVVIKGSCKPNRKCRLDF